MNPLSPRPYWRKLGAVGRLEAAAILSTSAYHIDQMRKAGELATLQRGRTVLIPTRELRRLLGEIEGEEPPVHEPATPRAPLSARARKVLREAQLRVVR